MTARISANRTETNFVISVTIRQKEREKKKKLNLNKSQIYLRIYLTAHGLKNYQ